MQYSILEEKRNISCGKSGDIQQETVTWLLALHQSEFPGSHYCTMIV